MRQSALAIPPIGLGTYLLYDKECRDAVRWALELGYRHIDTAHVYDNHREIATAIQGFDRGTLYLTSKLATDQLDLDKIELSVQRACEQALRELKTDYLDLYLVHWPERRLPMREICGAMGRLKEQQRVRAIGVCNATASLCEEMCLDALGVAVNQVELHPYLVQPLLHDVCQRRRIQLVAYRPLGRGALLEDPQLMQIGQTHRKSAAQIALRWLVQRGIPAIPKASSAQHLKENIEIFDFVLSEEEMQQISALDQNRRTCKPDWPEFAT